MTEIFVITEEEKKRFEVYTIPATEWSDWKCYMFGNEPNLTGLVWTPMKGQEPNWFWRKMQYLCFGNFWVKK